MVSGEIPTVSRKLRNAPLLYVVMIVDIAPVLSLETYIPAIQDALRRRGFPLIEQTQGMELTVTPGGMSTKEVNQWHFLNADRTTSILMSQTKIGLETGAYDTFAKFCQDLNTGISVALDVLGQGLIAQRIGLRYINALQPLAGEDFGTVFKQQLVGFEDSFAEVTNVNFQLYFQGTTPEGVLSVRVVQPPVVAGQLSPMLVLPPDLNTRLKLSLKFDVTQNYRFLDLDHATSTEMNLGLGQVQPLLSGLHDRIETVFIQAVHEDAYNRWAGEPSTY